MAHIRNVPWFLGKFIFWLLLGYYVCGSLSLGDIDKLQLWPTSFQSLTLEEFCYVSLQLGFAYMMDGLAIGVVFGFILSLKSRGVLRFFSRRFPFGVEEDWVFTIVIAAAVQMLCDEYVFLSISLFCGGVICSVMEDYDEDLSGFVDGVLSAYVSLLDPKLFDNSPKVLTVAFVLLVALYAKVTESFVRRVPRV